MHKAYIFPHRVIFKQLPPDRLHVVIGGGWPSMCGLPFLLPGLALMLLDFILGDYFINGVPVHAVLGLPFFLVGCSMLCFRRWLTFDLQHGSLSLASGMLRPMLRRERSLREFTSVNIHLLVSTGSGDSASADYYVEYYSVILTTAVVKENLTFNNCKTYGEAYVQAATLAAFLGLPVKDMSTEHPVEIAPSDLAHPVQARLREDAAIMQCAAPAQLRSEVQEFPHGVWISIPHQHWLARHNSTLVSIDEQNMRIEERRGKRTRNKVVIAIADIIDIDYNVLKDRRLSPFHAYLFQRASKGITLKTRQGDQTFGAGLPDDEVEYLVMVVENALRLVLAQPETL